MKGVVDGGSKGKAKHRKGMHGNRKSRDVELRTWSVEEKERTLIKGPSPVYLFLKIMIMIP